MKKFRKTRLLCQAMTFMVVTGLPILAVHAEELGTSAEYPASPAPAPASYSNVNPSGVPSNEQSASESAPMPSAEPGPATSAAPQSQPAPNAAAAVPPANAGAPGGASLRPAMANPNAPVAATSPAAQTGATFSANNSPEIKQSGDVTYVTGGVGEEERKGLEAAKSDYNLHVLISNHSGQLMADNRIVIQDKKGGQIVDTTAGPVFYAKLPPGSYVIKASGEGQTQTKSQNVTVGKGRSPNISFVW